MGLIRTDANRDLDPDDQSGWGWPRRLRNSADPRPEEVLTYLLTYSLTYLPTYLLTYLLTLCGPEARGGRQASGSTSSGQATEQVKSSEQRAGHRGERGSASGRFDRLIDSRFGYM